LDWNAFELGDKITSDHENLRKSVYIKNSETFEKLVILLFLQAVFDANIIPPLVQILDTAEFEVKREAVCAIYNVTSKGSYDNVRYKDDT